VVGADCLEGGAGAATATLVDEWAVTHCHGLEKVAVIMELPFVGAGGAATETGL
jgi:hypothetical protein